MHIYIYIVCIYIYMYMACVYIYICTCVYSMCTHNIMSLFAELAGVFRRDMEGPLWRSSAVHSKALVSQRSVFTLKVSLNPKPF